MADFGYAHFGEDDENEEEEGHGVRIKVMETCRCPKHFNYCLVH
jgi:hypothetical protein